MLLALEVAVRIAMGILHRSCSLDANKEGFQKVEAIQLARYYSYPVTIERIDLAIALG